MVEIETIALHEAGHAVARWIAGLPATELTADETGGLCAGTGRRLRTRPPDLVEVLLAGFAVESGYGLAEIDFSKSRVDDFDRARQILIDNPEWFTRALDEVLVPDEMLARCFEKTCECLCLYSDLIEIIGERLAWERRVSARAVAAICREFEKRLVRGVAA